MYYRTSELHWILYMMLKCHQCGRRYTQSLLVVLSNKNIHRFHGTPPQLVSGLLNYLRGMLNSTLGVFKVDLKYSG